MHAVYNNVRINYDCICVCVCCALTLLILYTYNVLSYWAHFQSLCRSIGALRSPRTGFYTSYITRYVRMYVCVFSACAQCGANDCLKGRHQGRDQWVYNVLHQIYCVCYVYYYYYYYAFLFIRMALMLYRHFSRCFLMLNL